jgi:spermidine synthase
VGESVRVTFLGEPRKVPKERSGLEWDFFVADVDDGSGEPRQMICPKSVRQHLAALLERGDLARLQGATVIVSAHAIDEFETTEGRVVPHAKVYRVTLPGESGRSDA